MYIILNTLCCIMLWDAIVQGSEEMNNELIRRKRWEKEKSTTKNKHFLREKLIVDYLVDGGGAEEEVEEEGGVEDEVEAEEVEVEVEEEVRED